MTGIEVWHFISPLLPLLAKDKAGSEEFIDAYVIIYNALKKYDEAKE